MKSNLLQAVNSQINKEMFSGYLYMAMSAKASEMGYAGVAKWFMAQYHEEMFHAMKFYEHLLERGEVPSLEAIQKPEVKEATVKALFERTLSHEKDVTASIHALMDLAVAEKDYALRSLLDWYVDEQVEEEKNAVDALTNLKLLGEGPQGVFMLNIELGKRKPETPLDFTGMAE
jgi:ferritin